MRPLLTFLTATFLTAKAADASATHWGGLLLWRTEQFREVVIAAANADEVNDAKQKLQRVHRLKSFGVEERTSTCPCSQAAWGSGWAFTLARMVLVRCPRPMPKQLVNC